MPSDRLLLLLRTRPNMPAAELRTTLGVNRTALMRMVHAAGDEVLTVGRARRTRYAARRVLPGCEQPLPVFEIDREGDYRQLANLHLAYPHGSVVERLEECPWPLDEEMREGWFEGLPYFLQDLRPEGFLGRAFARTYGSLLQLPENPNHWSEDDTLQAISRFGSDMVGNLIVGTAALRRYLDELQNSRELIQEADVPNAYLRLANIALSQGFADSSAAGEFPKFLATLERNGTCVKVLVKFSGADRSPAAQRWSDLLICEQLATVILPQLMGIDAVESRIVQTGGRTFLETVRFDRSGAHGRSAVCSWAAINYAWFGLAGRSWIEGAARLREAGLIAPPVADDIESIWLFGKLIANTDMHDGNLSFRPSHDGNETSLVLAPVYDMLPMLYAPTRAGELPTVSFQPPLPVPAERRLWARAAHAALQFWDLAAHDERISKSFRAICRENRDQVQRAMHLAGR